MTKDKFLKDKEYVMLLLQKEIEGIKGVELNRVYKMDVKSGQETWGILECFNKESARFRIIASNGPNVCDKTPYHMRGNIYSMYYYTLDMCLTRAKRSDVASFLGLAYRSKDVEILLSGKKTSIKIDE